MLFLKAFDYKEQEWELADDYYPVIPHEYRWSVWADDSEGITGDDLLEHINNMFAALRNLDTADDIKNRKWMIRSVMEGVNNFMKSGTLLRQVINRINADIKRRSKRLKGIRNHAHARPAYAPIKHGIVQLKV